jgi:carbon-monoxide dehydrogenase medium subunit
MNNFNYHKPGSLAEAVELIGRSSDARLLAGGMSLLPAMKLGFSAPNDLIDLASVPGLATIDETPDGVRIGAMTTHRSVAHSEIVKRRLPAIADLAGGIGDRQVRARGTIGGSLANNDPAACYPAAMLALNARIETDRRVIPADEFFRGIYQTALEADEVIVSVHISAPQAASYIKFLQPASHYALVGVCVARLASGVRVAVTGGGHGVFRCAPLEQALSARWSPAACHGVAIDRHELMDDLHASARYRAHLINILAARAVAAAR